jgi:hypothetical protein
MSVRFIGSKLLFSAFISSTEQAETEQNHCQRISHQDSRRHRIRSHPISFIIRKLRTRTSYSLWFCGDLFRSARRKKTGAARIHCVFGHAGLLVNGPPGLNPDCPLSSRPTTFARFFVLSRSANGVGSDSSSMITPGNANSKRFIFAHLTWCVFDGKATMVFILRLDCGALRRCAGLNSPMVNPSHTDQRTIGSEECQSNDLTRRPDLMRTLSKLLISRLRLTVR